jgi:hypothetical protein
VKRLDLSELEGWRVFFAMEEEDRAKRTPQATTDAPPAGKRALPVAKRRG